MKEHRCMTCSMAMRNTNSIGLAANVSLVAWKFIRPTHARACTNGRSPSIAPPGGWHAGCFKECEPCFALFVKPLLPAHTRGRARRFCCRGQRVHECLSLSVITALLRTSREARGALNRVAEKDDQPFAVMTAFLNTVPRQELEDAVSALESRISIEPDVLDEFAPLSWDMVETLYRGGMTIGSHTKSHTLLTTESAETVNRELIESKQVLEARLNAPITHFAYPDGRFTPDIVHAVGRAGYQFAYSICKSADPNRPLLTIPRKVLWERSCLDPYGTCF